ncbi:MAG: hypothetical protein SPH62_03225 [Candidatus Egerieousia sp.]|nr:hypothetical protein [Candidatus Egerieousia sp.]
MAGRLLARAPLLGICWQMRYSEDPSGRQCWQRRYSEEPSGINCRQG